MSNNSNNFDINTAYSYVKDYSYFIKKEVEKEGKKEEEKENNKNKSNENNREYLRFFQNREEVGFFGYFCLLFFFNFF